MRLCQYAALFMSLGLARNYSVWICTDGRMAEIPEVYRATVAIALTQDRGFLAQRHALEPVDGMITVVGIVGLPGDDLAAVPVQDRIQVGPPSARPCR